MDTATLNNKVYAFAGTTDEVTSCGCCGRTDLKRTIVLRPTDGGDYVFFGSACGARALGWTVKEFTAAAKRADTAAKQARLAAQREEQARRQDILTEALKRAKVAHGELLHIPFKERMQIVRTFTAQVEAELA